MPSVTYCTSYPVAADGKKWPPKTNSIYLALHFHTFICETLFGAQKICCCVQFNRRTDRRYLENESYPWSQIDSIEARNNCDWRTLVSTKKKLPHTYKDKHQYLKHGKWHCWSQLRSSTHKLISTQKNGVLSIFVWFCLVISCRAFSAQPTAAYNLA